MSAEGTLRDGQPAGLELIETLRWEPETGFLRRDLHLDRLHHSARALGFAPPPHDLSGRLEPAVTGDKPLRVRLSLDRQGRITIATQPFVPLALNTVWLLAIAETRLRSSNPLLRHKTSARQAYEAARAEFPTSEVDEVLMLNERGELCEGTFTSLFVRRGEIWLTPPLACGLLAGVLRADMLAQGIAREAVLAPPDLDGAEIAVGNSLRGLITARLT